jgi:hypothetical protein
MDHLDGGCRRHELPISISKPKVLVIAIFVTIWFFIGGLMKIILFPNLLRPSLPNYPKDVVKVWIISIAELLCLSEFLIRTSFG